MTEPLTGIELPSITELTWFLWLFLQLTFDYWPRQEVLHWRPEGKMCWMRSRDHRKDIPCILFCWHDDVIKWKHFPRYWPFVRGIHRSPVNSPHKGQWRGALMFSLMCVRINGCVNNREAGDLRRNQAHYDVIVMNIIIHAFENMAACCFNVFEMILCQSTCVNRPCILSTWIKQVRLVVSILIYTLKVEVDVLWQYLLRGLKQGIFHIHVLLSWLCFWKLFMSRENEYNEEILSPYIHCI